MPSYISSGRPSTDLTTVHPACSPSQRPSILGDSIKVFIHHDLIHWKYWKCKTIRSSGECCLRMELNMNMIDSPLKALKKMINIPIQIFTAYTQKWADFKKMLAKNNEDQFQPAIFIVCKRECIECEKRWQTKLNINSSQLGSVLLSLVSLSGALVSYQQVRQGCWALENIKTQLNGCWELRKNVTLSELKFECF